MAAAFVAERASAHHASGITTLGISVGSSILSNNLMVLVFCIAGGVIESLTSVTDNGTGSTWQIDVTQAAAATKGGIALASAAVGATPPTTVTVNMSQSSAFAYKILEFSGTATTSWFDVGTATDQGVGTAASAGPITPLTGELIVGGFNANTAQATFTGTSGYTSTGTPTNSANPDVCACYKLIGTTSETATGTFGTAVAVSAYGAVASYKLPAVAAFIAPPISDNYLHAPMVRGNVW